MKLTKSNNKWNPIAFVGYLMVFLFISLCIEAEGEKKQIYLNSSWDNSEDRSISFDCPIRAYYDALNLYLEGTSYSDITIQIFNGSETVLEEEAPAGTLPVTIPIFNLQKGIVYQLELTNSWGNRLVGEFFVE